MADFKKGTVNMAKSFGGVYEDLKVANAKNGAVALMGMPVYGKYAGVEHFPVEYFNDIAGMQAQIEALQAGIEAIESGEIVFPVSKERKTPKVVEPEPAKPKARTAQPKTAPVKTTHQAPAPVAKAKPKTTTTEIDDLDSIIMAVTKAVIASYKK